MLQLKDLQTYYGPVQVHFGLNMEVGENEIVCLLGGNASGKSTTMKSILGLVRPKAGSIAFRGEPILGLPTPEIVKRGIGSVPEARRIFPQMSVRENLLMGAYTRSSRTKVEKEEIESDYERILGLFPRLRERLAQKGGTLSGGEQQMLAMGRALMGRPKLICMDEPTMGLSPLYVDIVLALIQEINRQGVSVLMVEQNASLALGIAHRGYVLKMGKIVLEGMARDLLKSSEVKDAYLGGGTV